MSKFAERLLCLRTERKQLQTDIAKLLGVSQNVISKYESGINEPSFDSLILLAKHFEVSTDYLLGVTDNPKRNR